MVKRLPTGGKVTPVRRSKEAVRERSERAVRRSGALLRRGGVRLVSGPPEAKEIAVRKA